LAQTQRDISSPRANYQTKVRTESFRNTIFLEREFPCFHKLSNGSKFRKVLYYLRKKG
jgi:hypothetical protein